MARAESGHAGVAAGSGGKARGDLVEQARDHIVAPEAGGHEAAGVHLGGVILVRAVARDGDHPLGFPANRSGLGARGLDALVGEELFDQNSAHANPGA